jgi:cell division protein FtsX
MEQKQPKSLYDASSGEVAMKHFLAGFMQGLGGFFITIITWVMGYYLVTQYVVPQFSGMIGQAQDLVKSVEKNPGRR